MRHLEENDWQRRQSEPSQTLQYFNIMFDFPNTSKYKIEKWGTNERTTHSIISRQPPVSKSEETRLFIHEIHIDDLFGKAKVNMKDLLPTRITETNFDKKNKWRVSGNSRSYENKIERITLQDAPFLFVHLNRLVKYGNSEEKLTTILKPEVVIKTQHHELKLRSIIIHHGSEGGGHYTCLIKCNHQWYEYDDLTRKLELVGSIQDVYDHDHHYYMMNCTDFVYF